MSPITTHVLDTAIGRPAVGLAVKLYKLQVDTFGEVGAGVTNQDGRVTDLLPEGAAQPGVYRIQFDTATYFNTLDLSGFYPIVEITFKVEPENDHYHVPLLLSPFGYSTYRGS